MSSEVHVNAIDPVRSDRAPAGNLRANAALVLGAIALLGALAAFYLHIYSPHQDLAGSALSAGLAQSLGDSFDEYSLYFPPAERMWFGLAAWLSALTSIRLDIMVVLLTGAAVLFSGTLAYRIRSQTVGATPLFLVLSVMLLVVLPILYKNVFGLREHLVILGLWPYLILRLSDPDDSKIGWKTRAVVGLWLGSTLLMKYLYALTVLLVELADAAFQRRPFAVLRAENLIAGGIVALYIFVWLVLDPAQREALATLRSAIDANLADTAQSLKQAATHLVLALFLLLLGYLYKVPGRLSVIGLALVLAAIAVSWIQARWYTHHLFPITMAYAAWVWMIHRHVRLIWILAVSLLFVRPIAGEFASTASYQRAVAEFGSAMDTANISVAGKRVGLLNMHPSPTNQYLASHGGIRWISSMNNAYVASALQPFDLPENAGKPTPAVELEDPGIQMLHDEMLRLWEDAPPDALILDQSTSWPLQHIEVDWQQAFAKDARFQAILSHYRPVFHHKGERLDFTYYVRKKEGER